MKENVVQLFERYRKTGVLLDTNILLLYYVGAFNKNEIPKFKRTKIFAIEDYDTLISVLHCFETIVTTPNILTEVSNLSGQLGEHLRSAYFDLLSLRITLLKEDYIPSHQVAGLNEFKRFGLTDTTIMYLAKGKYLVLTEDFRLSQYLQHVGVDVLNFNHIRPLFWR